MVIKIYYGFRKATIKTKMSGLDKKKLSSSLPFDLGRRNRAISSWRRAAAATVLGDLSLPTLEKALRTTAKLRAPLPTEELPEEAPGPWLALREKGSDRRAVLHLSQHTAAALAMRALGLDRLSRPALSPVELGGLMFALDRLAADVNSALGHCAILAGPLCDLEQARQYIGCPRPIRLPFCLELEGEPFPLGLLLPESLLPLLPVLGAPRRTPEWVLRAPVLFDLHIGASAVQALALEKLSLGDLLTLDELCHPQRRLPGSTAFLRAGQFELPLEWLDSARMRIASTLNCFSAERPMPTKDTTASTDKIHELFDHQSKGPILGGDLPVNVRVECGQLELTVAEASALRPGDVLRLGKPLGAEVNLCVGGRRIGRGQLVEVERELAVELLEIEK
jgi:type III secretion system YscQ/HrcQ family protein